MSVQKSVEDEKKQLLSRLLLSVKSCQSRFGSRTELATEDDTLIRQLCSTFEDVFLNGLLRKPSSSQSSLWQITESLVPGLRCNEVPSFWPLIKSQLSKHESERFLLLHHVRTDLGRGRAWLRAALNEHSLERYIHVIVSLDNLDTFYDKSSFLRDNELSSILPQTAAGLGSILFALIVDNQGLDKVQGAFMDSMVEDPIAKSVSEFTEIADEAMDRSKSAVINPVEQVGTKLRKGKKKKKIPTTYVSFDEPESSVSTSSVPSSCLNTPTDKHPPISTSIKPVKIETESDKSDSHAFVTVIPPETPTSKEFPVVSNSIGIEIEKISSIYSSSIKSSDNISLYSDSSDRLDIENLILAGISPSDRLKPIGSDGYSISIAVGGDPERTEDLIPVPSYSNGDEERGNEADDGEKTCENEVVLSISKIEQRIYDGEDTTTLSTEVVEEDRFRKLKTILDHEFEMVANLKVQLAEDRRNHNDETKILETRVETLTKENELLKHQLKKYIGAVQLLKDAGVGRRMSFGVDEVDVLENSSTNEQSTEAVEYERKLIQVAEMHGELMEFNTYLQGVLQRKDQALRTLHEELVDLRGPIENDLVDDDNSSLDISYQQPEAARGQRLNRQLSNNERILINIWIPSAFLTGATNDLHHVYQVFLRIKDTEWNVYRRYSQFHNFHRDLKKQDSIIGCFYFPPKKHIGNRDTKFVDDRRRKLQEYLRKVINHTLKTNSILASHPDKNLLISILPFFGENTQPMKPKRSRSQSRNIFFRQTESTEQQFSQGLVYPQYTGL